MTVTGRFPRIHLVVDRTVSEIAAIFRQWLDVLERGLEPEVYFRLVPELRKVSGIGLQRATT